MDAPWPSFRSELRFCIRRKSNLHRFLGLRQRLPKFLETPEDVVEFLATRNGDREARARVLRVLMLVVRAGQPDADLAMAMLALGRWRDLDLIHERWRRAFVGDPDEVVSMIRTAFAWTVHMMDLERSFNPEASLSLSTERSLKNWWAKERRRREITTDATGETGRLPDPDSVEHGTPSGFPAATSVLSRMEALDGIARQAAGEDVEIVYAVDLLGYDLGEVAARLSISREASKKRYQRAKTRVARALREAGLEPCPHHPRSPATPGYEGDKRPGGDG